MIIVRLFGGLGNQMFQYALARSLSIKNNDKLCVYFDNGNDNVERKYSLDVFGIKQSERKVVFLKFFYQIAGRYVKEVRFNFNKSIVDINKGVFLDGYWQSYKYFEVFSEEIKKDFVFKKQVKYPLENDAVSIHIRGTDYKNNSIHQCCGENYYKKAIKLISEKVKKPKFYVFTDDVWWVKKNFVFLSDFLIVSELGYKYEEEMQIMSRCQHNIIANSSFSWWAAWLNTYKNKIIISPRRWFNNSKINIEDRIPKDWIKI